MSEPKTVRVEIEFEDGRIISLHGDDAQAWQEMASGMAVMSFVHGGSQKPFPWKETFTTTADVKGEADGSAH